MTRARSTARKLAGLKADLAAAPAAPAASPPAGAGAAPVGAAPSGGCPFRGCGVEDAERQLRALVRARPLTAAGLSLLAGAVVGGLLLRGGKK
ncbi:MULTISPECIES: hypothetical protein [unclassified Xanthobacter]|uniref:hypothetical protein n=1 Tax=unclassified Xanthobacter TaxID=2623496 RepID=UPI001EE0DFB5|nr:MULTISPECIES: hypothetical protein [unclassified Xanthobacter]